MTGFSLIGKKLEYRGDTDRYYKNVAAIELLRQLQRVKATDITDTQRMTLAHYSAFGTSANLNMAFSNYRGIQDITTADEQDRIKRSSLTAFYTSQDILVAKWSGLAPILRNYLAANPGPLKVLEPAFGVGMYVATMPQDIRERSEITAVEMDAISSQIAAYLHPDVRLFGTQRFEETDLPESYYDLVMSNVPFGATRVFDPNFKNEERFLTRTVHDYFLARSLKLVRPGGLVAILTSYGTMDKEDERFRHWVAERADLVYAVRLPQGTFSANAGTECGTDLLIFRRYDEGDEIEPAPMWTTTEMGAVDYVSDWHGGGFTTASKLDDNEFTLIPRGRDAQGFQTPPGATLRMNYLFASQADATIGKASVVAYGDYFFSYVQMPKNGTVANALTLDIAAWQMELEPQRPVIEKPQAAKKKVAPLADREAPIAKRLLAIEAVARNLIDADVNGREIAVQNRARLNELYDAFVAEYGVIHTPKNLKALKGEPELLFLRALESNVQVVGTAVQATKATLFSRPVVQRNILSPTETLSPSDAILYTLEEKGYLDMDRMQHLTGMTEDELFDALRGQVYRNHVQEAQSALMPRTKAKYPKYVLAEEYLSGNVREKFLEAYEASRKDSRFEENAEALRRVIPKALTSNQLRVNMRAPWVPTTDYEAFITELVPQFGYTHNKGIVKYHQLLARWVVEDPGYARQSNEATVTWGTSRMHALDIIEAVMNQRQITVRDSLDDGKTVVNQKETLLAREKAQRIEERWAVWLWEDYDREKRLVEQYNILFNSTVKRSFSGAHLTFPGMNTSMLRGGKLADYQADAVWMALNRRGCLLDLRVGAGKTFIMLAIAYEGKRLGLFSKPVVTVPNHLVGQWALEANRLYPSMRVLAMAPEDFSKGRGTFLSRIMTEDWDLIIIGHSTFGLIDPGEVAREYIDQQIVEYRAYLEELRIQQQNERTRAKKKSIKDIEKALENFETKIKEMDARKKHDGIVDWDELGVDWLAVDEAHEFKNLGIPTSMGSIPGVPKGNSQRAFDMRIKTWDMLRREGRVVFATGTPVLNTLGEVFIMQKYLQEEVLIAHGINHFDSWASTFATTQTVFEMTPDGGGFRLNTRLSKFVNLPELFAMWFEFVFSRANDALNLPTPKIMGGRPLGFSVPGTPTLKKLVQSFVARVDDIKNGRVEPTEDNMLKVTSDGRKAALDVRLVLGGTEERVCKINYLVNLVYEVYKKYDAAKGTQLIYCELSTPKGRADGKPTQHKEGVKSIAQQEKELVKAKQAAERAELRLLVQEERIESPTGEEEEVLTAEEEANNNFVYHEIRAKLGVLGIPASEIAFIQHYNTAGKRNQLFADMNAGKVRVLICSKQSTGMNIQRRLVAEWNLDAPWRPGDLEQRYGRIERQGNMWPEIIIGNLVTEGSFDGYTWQLLETKARFIQQMRSQDITMREIDDISAVVLTASEIKALASGNPAIRRKVEIEAQLMKLDAVSGGFKDAQRRMTESIRNARQNRAEHKQRKIILAHAMKVVEAHPAVPKEFKANLVESAMSYTIKAYTTDVPEGEEPVKPGLIRKTAGEHLQRLVDQLNGQAEQMNQVLDRTVGNYRGLLIRIKAAPKKHFANGMVYLAVDDEDEVPSPVYEIRGETEEGLFVSADAGIRGLEASHDACDGRVDDLARQIKTIEAEQAKPWDQAQLYADLQAEYAKITAELYADKEAEKATETAVVKVAALPVELPMVILPEPSDSAAMDRAMLRLIEEDVTYVMPTFTLNPATQVVTLKSVESAEEVGAPTIRHLFTPAKIEVATEIIEAAKPSEESFVPRSVGFARFVKASELKGKYKPKVADETVEQAVMF